MRIIKTLGRRGPSDTMWSVGGTVRCLTIEEAVELAFEVRAEQMAQAPQRNLWSVYGVVA